MLARDLGFRSRAAMYEALTAEELAEWEEGYGIDPWGPGRDETLHGILCSLIDACHRTRGRPEPPISYMPFVKSIQEPKPAMKEEDMKAIWKNAVASWGN